MTAGTRQPFFARLTALAVAPFLLGRRAISLEWAQAEGSPPPVPAPVPPAVPARLAIHPPEHAIQRRG